ncbi:MAG: hypothetical protein PHG48_04860 [Eubacteriales bacterium]|nr:hypothetical protein [Eubacteriales bacterium]
MKTDMIKPLRTGAAYHGNRMPQHMEQDLRDMVSHNMNLVVHMFTHNDWDRHKNKMRDAVSMSIEAGLEVWIDNWGLGGPPGDKSHFLAYYPDSHIYYSNGDMDPVRACLNSLDFRQFTREWIDAVQYIGGTAIFWDEPHLPLKNAGDKTCYACCCKRCKSLFKEKFGRDMPAEIDEDVKNFRVDTIIDYFREVTDYSASKGIKNAVCVMLDAKRGISLETIDRICSLPNLDNIGSDPYWLGKQGVNPYQFVYENSKRNIDISNGFGKDHNIWIQAYSTPRGREDEIIGAVEGAYDAGARTILAWGYYGSSSNDYAAKNPHLAWTRTCEAMARIWDMERNRMLEDNRKLYRKA